MVCPTCHQPLNPVNPLALLSPREIQAVELIAGGYGNEYVAKSLHTTLRTVEHHINSIISKWGYLMGADEDGLVEGAPIHKRVKLVLIYLRAKEELEGPGRTVLSREGEIERREAAWERKLTERSGEME